MTLISRTTCTTEKSYTSLESPHFQLFGGLKTYGVAIPKNRYAPLNESQTVFTKKGVADK